jgi:hypothetical protein
VGFRLLAVLSVPDLNYKVAMHVLKQVNLSVTNQHTKWVSSAPSNAETAQKTLPVRL